jgi:peptide/nickel transport system substrate-binding protein
LNVPKEYSTPERETLKIPEVREAISLAIDQRSLIEKVLRGSGKPVPSGLISESSILYNPEVGIGQPEIEKANKLLDASGFLLKSGEKIRSRDNVKLSYKISGNQGNKNLINYIKVQLEKIGIEVMFEEGGSNAVKDRYYTGNFDMTIQGVIFNMANVDMMMVAHFVTVGSSSNYGRLNDPVLKSIVQEMRTTLSEKNKIEKLKEIQKYIADLNYKIPLYCPDIISVYRTDIYDGWTTEKGTNIYNNETLSNLKFKNY